MKKLLISTIGLAAVMLAGVFTGCSTTSIVTTDSATGISTTNTVHQFDPTKTASVMQQVIPPGVKLVLQVTPQYRPYILDAQGAICALVGSTNVTPQDIANVFNQTGNAAIETPEMEGVASTVYGIYSAFYNDLILEHLPQNQVIAAMNIVLTGICNGLTQGLAQAPIAVPPVPNP